MFLSLLTVFFLLNSISAQTSDSFSCIKNYKELKATLRDNTTDNIEKLLDTFYPPNESTVHSVLVTYCFVTPNTTNNCSDNITYQWSSNALLLVVEPDLLDALTLYLFDLISRNVSLVMSTPFCSSTLNDNLLLMDTLSTWLESYANSDSETVQGYAIYYNPETEEFIRNTYNIVQLRVSILVWLIFVALSMALVLNGRLCSKRVYKKTEKTAAKVVDSAIAIVSFVKDLKDMFTKKEKAVDKNNNDTKNNSKSKASDENKLSDTTVEESVKTNVVKKTILSTKTKYLNHIASIENIIAYVLMLTFFIVWDIYTYTKTKKNHIMDWYAFFPFPIIVPVLFVVSLVITALTGIFVIVSRIRRHKNLNLLNLLKDLFAALILTILIIFIVFHGFWALLMTVTYPDRITSAALFIIPLYFPLQLVLKTASTFIKSLSEQAKEKFDKTKIKMYARDWRNLLLDNVIGFAKRAPNYCIPISGVIFFLLFWFLLLTVLYYASDFLLVITDIRKDPIKLVVFVVFTVVATHRLAKICTPDDQEEEEEEEVYTMVEDENRNEEELDSVTIKTQRRKPPLPPPKPYSNNELQEIPLEYPSSSPQHEDTRKETIYDTVSIGSNDFDSSVYSLASHKET